MGSSGSEQFSAGACSGNLRDGRTVAGVSGGTARLRLREQQAGAGGTKKNLHRASRLWATHSWSATVHAQRTAQAGSGGVRRLGRGEVPGSAGESPCIRKDKKDQDINTNGTNETSARNYPNTNAIRSRTIGGASHTGYPVRCMEAQTVMAAAWHLSPSPSNRGRAGIQRAVGSNACQLCRYERTGTEQRSANHRGTAQSSRNSRLYKRSVPFLAQRGGTGKAQMGTLCRRDSRRRGSCRRNLCTASKLGAAFARCDGVRGSQGTRAQWCAHSAASRRSDFAKV